MIGSMDEGGSGLSTSSCNDSGLQRRPKVFLSHSGAQKGFVEQLWVDLKRCGHDAFFDKDQDCLPMGKIFQGLSLKLLSNVKLEWLCYQRNFSLPNGPCWSWWQ